MLNKLLRTIIGLPFVLVGFVCQYFVVTILIAFAWLFDDVVCRGIAVDVKSLGWTPRKFLEKVWKVEGKNERR